MTLGVSVLVQSVYSVRDLKGETYSLPFFAVNDRVAMRMFGDACADRGTPVGLHPEDYLLFRVGVWNADNGALAGTESPIPVWSGVEAAKAARMEVA